MSAYLVRERAEADLADIWRYTATRWDIAQADKYHGALVGAFRNLAEKPNLGRACDEIRAGYQRLSVASHVIFYILTDGKVDIVRVLHARRDFRRHLPAD